MPKEGPIIGGGWMGRQDIKDLPEPPRGGSSALSHQEGGDHYKNKPIQPVEYCMANGIGFMEGCVIKYATRWREKGGIQDLKKARHFLDLLIEYEEGRE